MARMTIRDIARLAGVSVTTVSRALNNAPEINSQTRERVLQVCREQGYRSNLLARSLVSSRTRVLGVIPRLAPDGKAHRLLGQPDRADIPHT